MKAMIMAAGVGSRLMPLTMKIPKPMVPMANKPLMENIVELLHQHGFNDIIANLHYHADIISGYFNDGTKFGVDMNYSREEELLGTAGGVKKCEWFLNDTFVVISGDALTDIDLTSLLNKHKTNGALATIALKEVSEVEHFGVVVTDEKGRINKFQEKPRPEEALSNLANTGIYIFEPEIFKYIPARQFYDFGKQVFPHLVKIGAPFYGVSINDYWCDVGNLETYKKAHIDILEGLVKVGISGNLVKNPQGTALVGEGTDLGSEVSIQGHVVLGSGCKIQNGVIINNSVLWGNTTVCSNAVIDNCILGEGCLVGRFSHVKPGAVIASDCIIEDNVDINAGQKVFDNISNHNLNQG